MKQRTPQEKKRLSYAKDRRNCFGENDKAARKAIRRNKVLPSRAYRRRVHQLLQREAAGLDIERAAFLDSDLRALKRRIWKKIPDKPLGLVMQWRMEAKQFIEQIRNQQLEKEDSVARN
jgi:hypothetical protein